VRHAVVPRGLGRAGRRQRCRYRDRRAHVRTRLRGARHIRGEERRHRRHREPRRGEPSQKGAAVDGALLQRVGSLFVFAGHGPNCREEARHRQSNLPDLPPGGRTRVLRNIALAPPLGQPVRS